ncbi:MAG: FliH/SctL family protein [Nitrospiria bacterium]
MARHLSKIIKSDLFEKSEIYDFPLREVSLIQLSEREASSELPIPSLAEETTDENDIPANTDNTEPRHEAKVEIEATETAEALEEDGPIEDETHDTDEDNIGGLLAEIEREAYEKGFSAGEEAGRVLGLQKLDPVEKILLNLIQEITHFKETTLKKSEQAILEIALATAHRVIRREVAENRDIITQTIQEAIKKIGQNEKILIRLHPDDLEIISQDAARIAASTQQEAADLRVEPDPGLLPGDCIVEGEERMIDARLSHQVDLIEENLKSKET